MKRYTMGILALFVAATALADLQNVEVGGQIRIRGRYWSNTYTDAPRETRIPDFFMPGRAIGPFGTESRMLFDDRSNDKNQVEQSTKLQFRADFTDNVKGVIELDDTEVWGGEDFRSDYITGTDSRAATGNDVELLQAYVQTGETFGLPLQMKIGRQQIQLNDGWLVGKTQSTLELAFDGIRLTYDAGPFVVDGWATKLFEGGIFEEDGDVDFYGLDVTYRGIPNQEFTAYWLLVRDGRSIDDTSFIAPIERLEDLVNLDDYDPTNLHTFGLHADGKVAAVDYVLELAYQTGNADSVGHLFAPYGYGDPAARFDSWAGDVEIGYTFDVPWQPRLFLGGAYSGGEDNRDLSFLEWISPFHRPEASVSFNRLFSSRTYNEVFDQNRNTSNFNHIRLGAEARPFESVKTGVTMIKIQANEAFDSPMTINAGPFRIPVAPALPFLTEEAGKDIGWLARFDLYYDYSDNLQFRILYEHLFTSGDVEEGNFMNANGLEFYGGADSDDASYVGLESILKF